MIDYTCCTCYFCYMRCYCIGNKPSCHILVPYFNAGTSVGGSNTHAHTLNSGYAKITSGGSAVLFNYKNVNTFNTNWAVNGSANGVSSSSVTTATTLGGNTDSNYHMPAYQELYAWRRTA